MAATGRTSARVVRAARGPPRGVTWQFAGGSGRNTGAPQQPRGARLLQCVQVATTMIDDRRWGGRCRDEPQLCMQMSMRGAMYVTMTMLRPGLFLQREGPGSEPGNSLVRPDDRGLRVRS